MLLDNTTHVLPELTGTDLLPNANTIRRAIAGARPGDMPDVLAKGEQDSLPGRVPRVPRFA